MIRVDTESSIKRRWLPYAWTHHPRTTIGKGYVYFVAGWLRTCVIVRFGRQQ